MKRLIIRKKSRKNFLTYGIVVAAYAALMAVMAAGAMPSAIQGLLVPMCAYIIAAVSLNLTVGVLGELSLGHAGFMSVGAFTGCTAAMALANSGMPSWGRMAAAVVVGSLLAAAAGALVGVPVLRLQGDYLAIVTLAFGEIIKTVVT